MSSIAPVMDETQNAVDHAVIKERLEQNDELHKRINGHLFEIKNELKALREMIHRRLPLWTTLLIGLLSAGLSMFLGLYLKT